ncbi:unnamed protein product [Dimorphilus gyrociliatus]|uniref:Uncharacterized protein n=1 Tax=Dimorphilus gyrociliatus TaxID=2664684 RepID=A0A7I8W608_9ANNE|nr:unnamed protein product [Dimorphilus gyrociliatus]
MRMTTTPSPDKHFLPPISRGGTSSDDNRDASSEPPSRLPSLDTFSTSSRISQSTSEPSSGLTRLPHIGKCAQESKTLTGDILERELEILKKKKSEANKSQPATAREESSRSSHQQPLLLPIRQNTNRKSRRRRKEKLQPKLSTEQDGDEKCRKWLGDSNT